MSIYDSKGRLIIPEPERLKTLGRAKGVLAGEKKILIKQIYCPNGHSLISAENVKFDGEAGIHLLCEGKTIRQSVFLSPFQNDARKEYQKAFEDGEVLRIFCPVCEAEFPKLAPHDCQSGAMYIALFLDKNANLNNSVCVCNVWGCYSSFLRLSGEILSEVRYQFFLR